MLQIGPPRFEATFVTADRKKVVATREAMELTSNHTGNQCHVCRRHEDWRAAKVANTLQALESAGFGLDDVITR